MEQFEVKNLFFQSSRLKGNIPEYSTGRLVQIYAKIRTH